MELSSSDHDPGGVSIVRHFLGWTQPVLATVVRRLYERYAVGTVWDLRELLIVLPSGLAVRRLSELLALESQKYEATFYPPEIVTLGNLPERLYVAKRPFASNLVQRLAWTAALKETPLADLVRIVPHPPQASATQQWLELGQTLTDLHSDLAGDCLDFSKVATILGKTHVETPRWHALAKIQRSYLDQLHNHQLWDIQTARLRALEEDEASSNRQIIVIGCSDLNRTQRRFLEAVASRVQIWIAAPDQRREDFDGMGCLDSTVWQSHPVDIPSDALLVGNSPGDQADLVAAVMAELGDTYHVRQVTLGVPDSELISELRHQLERCRVRTRFGPGQPLSQFQPARLLRLIGQYTETRSYAALSALIRHPVVDQMLGTAVPPLPADWLSQMDAYCQAALPKTTGGFVFESHESAKTFLAVNHLISKWLAPLQDQPKPVTHWINRLLSIMATAYGQTSCHPDDPEEQLLYLAAVQISQAISALGDIPSVFEPSMTVAELIEWLFREMAGQLLPEPADPSAVEMLGWLELAWDDAPVLIVAGMHDGVTPESVSGDTFLPNQLRHQLGMLDNARRFARDMYYLQLMLSSRKQTKIVVGKTDVDGEPLVPSRLLLACDLSQLPARVLHLVQEDCADVLPCVENLWQPVDGPSQLVIPRPQPVTAPTRMSVTSFRDYLSCPYRYYLRHMLKLRGQQDEDEELRANMFGDLVHGALDAFGKADVSRSQDALEITDFLVERLHHLAEIQFGKRISVAVEIQIQQAQARLEAFAIQQAQRASQGWEIRFTESGVTAEDQVMIGTNSEMCLIGRIDRIDFHPETGQWAIWDYKTSESAKNPLTVHWNKKLGWQDLQLPLYIPIARKMGVTGWPTLGYIALPKQIRDINFYPAEFSSAMLEDALGVADRIASQVAKCQFWPERIEAVDYDDYARICQMHVQNVQASMPDRRLHRFNGYSTQQVPDDVVIQAKGRLSSPLVRTPIKLQPLLIRASAGTGKTYQLTNRLLHILLSGQEVDGILATTFTRKAAGEIMQRLLQRLALACIKPSSQRQLAESLPEVVATADACLAALKRVTSSIHRLRIGTLDSFFAQLARTFSLDMGLPAGWEAMDPVDEPRAQSRAIAEMLELHERSALLTLIRMLTKGDSSRRVSDDVRQAVNNGYSIFRTTTQPDWDKLSVPVAPPESEIETALNVIQNCRFNSKQIDPQLEKLHLLTSIGDWEQVIKHGVIGALANDPPSYYRKKLPDDLVSALQLVADAAKTYLLASFRAQTLATYQAIEAYDQSYSNVIRRMRTFAFSDVAHLLARWIHDNRLRANSASALGGVSLEQLEFRLDCKIQHMLLDEFQDTSIAQWDILRPLAGPLGGAARSEQSFFCVGDSKQAIYGWRGGVAQIFDVVGLTVAGLHEEPLVESRRNSLPITHAVNDVFQNLERHPNFAGCEAVAAAWSKQFPPHLTVQTSLSGYTKMQNLPEPDDPDLTKEEKNLVRMVFAADTIAELVQRCSASIGVLFRTNDDVALMMSLLRDRGIPASQDGGNPLTDSAAVELILSLVHLADHPGDGICEFHVRNSPLWELLPPAARVSSLGLSQWFRQQVSRQGLSKSIKWVCSQLANHLSWWDQQRLVQLIRSAQLFSASGGRLRDFEARVALNKVALPTEAQVKVMTIHGSKGLEFDAVFLPALDQQLSKRAPYLITREPNPCQPPDGVIRYMNSSIQAILPESWQRAFVEDKASGVVESLCLLYVAMTRARNALYMFTNVSGASPRQDVSSLLHSTLASGLSEISQPTATLYESGRADWFLESHRRSSESQNLKMASPQPTAGIRLRRDAVQVQSHGPEHAHSLKSDQLNLSSIAQAFSNQRGSAG